MIHIGLTGWGDHPDLYMDGAASRNKLKEYSAHFPIVELDSAFYAIQPVKNYSKWIEETPSHFSFIIKAFQGMTGHLQDANPFHTMGVMFSSFIHSIAPVVAANKMKAVLFQYPPWFECEKKNIDILRYTKEKMGELPVAIEFRHRSWFDGPMLDKTLMFMENEGWIHCICDEPQVGSGSIPPVIHPTNHELTLVRMHGRNVHGWNNNGASNWREVRYLYRYNREELLEWKEKFDVLLKTTKELCVVFNNNSGGDAAANAKEMMAMLGIQYENTIPRQLGLFE